MTATTHRTETIAPVDRDRQPIPAQPHRTVDVLRIGLGFVFLWALLDKLFGLGYATSNEASWINGGSPTRGFLGHVEVGPLQSMFRGMAGHALVDTLFMLGLLGVGAALILGVLLRITAIAGAVLLLLMWAAEWPPAQHTTGGAATSSSNPLVDYHLIFAIGLFVVAALGTASSWGLGRWWAGTSVVRRHALLA